MPISRKFYTLSVIPSYSTAALSLCHLKQLFDFPLCPYSDTTPNKKFCWTNAKHEVAMKSFQIGLNVNTNSNSQCICLLTDLLAPPHVHAPPSTEGDETCLCNCLWIGEQLTSGTFLSIQIC